MAATLLGVAIDSSVLVAAERQQLTARQAIENIERRVGEIPIILCAMTVAELGHGIYRAQTAEIRSKRRLFLDDLKASIPVYPVTQSTAEIIAKVGGILASQGINLPLADLIIGACALELGYAVATSNVRDFARIPGLGIVRL